MTYDYHLKQFYLCKELQSDVIELRYWTAV